MKASITTKASVNRLATDDFCLAIENLQYFGNLLGSQTHFQNRIQNKRLKWNRLVIDSLFPVEKG